MRIVVTGANSTLGRALLAALGAEGTAFAGDVRDSEAVRAALAGAEVVVHLAPAFGTQAGTGDDWRQDREALDRAARGTYVLLNAAVESGVRRVVLGSTLALFSRYPRSWIVDESWRPEPDVTDVRQLAAYLAEESAKQIAHVEPIQVVCLRLGAAGDSGAADGVQAVREALNQPPTRRGEHSSGRIDYGWWVRHVGERPLLPHPSPPVPLSGTVEPSSRAPLPGTGEGWRPYPTRGLSAPSAAGIADNWSEIPAVRNVVIFGAGGPLAAAAAPVLAGSYRLRLTDLRSIAEIAAEGKPQSTGAPLPAVLPPPHEARVVDVADLDQVLAACEGMDAVVNCTVVRPHPVTAFLVNCIGAYHVMRAAVAHGIRRVVHTGPLQVLNDRQGGYGWDFGIPDDAPPRPGAWLYTHSKYLGQEIVRLFAEQYGMSVPTLLFCNFANPAVRRPGSGVSPFTISWEDAGHAIRRAVEVPELPSPFESLHILADLPHGKYSARKAYRLLGWYPRDDLSELYSRAE